MRFTIHPHLQQRALALAIGFLLSGISGAAAPAAPNIVLILSDDQGWTDYGFMGHEVIKTPHLDRLARESVVFPRGYVPTPLCRPSLMSIVTGRFPHQHGITGNDPSPKLAEEYSPEFRRLAERMVTNVDRVPTLPKLLVAHGYLAHQSGKWWEGSFTRGGFTHGMTKGDIGGKQRHGDAGLSIGREGMEPVFSFIQTAQQAGKPFYLWYAPFLPHTPHNPPTRILAQYTQAGREPALARYYAMCEWFDETCGQLIDYLDRNDLRRNTLIYYLCDNGWIQRTPTTPVPVGWKDSFAPGSKLSVQDGGIRTPILLSWPGVLRPGTRDELVSSVDLMPTLLGAAGVPVPSNLPGRSLWPELKSGRKIDRDIIFGDAYAHDVADLGNPEESLLHLWCIQGEWKLILTYDGEVNRYALVHSRTPPVQLFNVVRDPHEKSELSAQHPERVRELRRKIEAWYPLKKRRLVAAKSLPAP